MNEENVPFGLLVLAYTKALQAFDNSFQAVLNFNKSPLLVTDAVVVGIYEEVIVLLLSVCAQSI
jgi:hypothetical protein